MSLRHLSAGWLLLATVLVAQTAEKPKIPVNYDEAQVGTYTLPDPLTCVCI